MAKKILIVYHSQSGNTEAAAQAVAEGVTSVEGAEAVVKKASETGVDDLTSSDGYCFGTPDYFSYMAGMLKDLFDRTLYEVKGQLDDRPCGLFVTHGGGGKASDSMEKICGSFKLKQIGETLLVKNKPDDAAQEALKGLGSAVAKSVL